MTNFCERCGTKYQPGDRFCPKCGAIRADLGSAPRPWPDRAAAPPPPPPQPDGAPPPPAPEPEAPNPEDEKFAIALNAATPTAYVTPILIALNLAVFVLMVIKGLSFTDPTSGELIRWGADFGPLTTHGQWWRLLTAAFVHIGFVHVLMNMFILFSVGRFTERLFGNACYLALYLLAAIGGNLASCMWQPFTVAAGASGAVFGVYGALLAFFLLRRGAVPRHTVVSLSKGAGYFLLYNFAYGIVRANAHIDVAAHVGGFVTGFLAGCCLALPLPAPAASRLRRGFVVGLVGVGFAIALAYRLRAGDDTQAEWYRQAFTAPSVAVGQENRIIYAGFATEQDAERLGQTLQQSGFFQTRGVEVLLSKTRAGTAISFSVKDGAWDDQAYLSNAQDFAGDLAPFVGGVPISIVLRDSNHQVRKEIRAIANRLTVGTKGRVEYDGAATPEEAQTLGQALRNIGFFTDTGALVTLSKGRGGTEVTLSVREGYWDDPQSTVAMEDFGRKMAPSLGGFPITLRLMNTRREAKKEITLR